MFAVITENGPCSDRRRIRATRRLGQTEACNLLPTRTLGKVLRFLFRRAEKKNALKADGLMSAQRDSYTQIVSADNLNKTSVLGVGQANTT